jgi:hypothetical protein
MEQLELLQVTGSCVDGANARHPGISHAKKRARTGVNRSNSLNGWVLEPHVCRHCFGRLASRQDGHQTRYQCTNCGADAAGHATDVLCACGLALRNHGPAGGTLDAGLRCQANPAPSPEFPSLYVAAEPRT